MNNSFNHAGNLDALLKAQNILNRLMTATLDDTLAFGILCHAKAFIHAERSALVGREEVPVHVPRAKWIEAKTLGHKAMASAKVRRMLDTGTLDAGMIVDVDVAERSIEILAVDTRY